MKTSHQSAEPQKKTHLDTLIQFQRWRRGDETEDMPAPEEIGKALDWAIEQLSVVNGDSSKGCPR